MKARHNFHRTHVGVLSCVLLLQAACTTEGSSDSSGAPPTDAVPTATATTTSDFGEAVDTEPARCPSEPLPSWVVGEIGTRRLVAHGDLGDVAVSRTGTAIIAWTASVDSGEVRTMDDPAAPGDPRSPAGPPDPQHREVFNAFGEDVLDIDAGGMQTLLWLSDERGQGGGPAPFTEYFDVVLADRSPGGAWSSSPSVVGAGYVWNARLAVNASGAAVVTWHQYEGPTSRVYASYRQAAGAEWTRTELVAKNSSLWQVGIDDAGRVLLLISRGQNARTRMYTVRRTPDGGWEDPRRLAGGDLGGELTVGANGSAVVVRGRVSYDADTHAGSQFTLRMTPSGRWQPRVRQPALTDTVFGRSVDMDAKGRVLLAWWDGADLMVRWSRPDGGWRRPCVLAAGVRKSRSIDPDAQLALNRRGDALVVWAANGRVPQLWARYKPSGQGWTKPVKVTRMSSPPGSYAAELGAGGHAAITWTPRNGREVHIVRTSPTH